MSPTMASQRPTRQRIWRALRASDGNVAAAARALGCTPQALAYRIERHGLRARLEALWRAQEPDAPALRRALHASGGRLAAAARALGCSVSTVETQIARHRLARHVAALQARVAHEEATRRLDALTRHRGNVAAAARALAIRVSSLQRWIERRALGDTVAALRPRRPTPAEERALLASLVDKHHGQQWKIRRELAIAKGTLRARLARHGLARQAAERRIEAHKTGPRKQVRSDRYKRTERRERLIALLDAVGWNVRSAIRRSGVSHGTFYALLRTLGIERPRTLSPAQRLHRLVDALRLFRGDLTRVGRSLKLPDATVRAWCSELDVDPRDYR